MDYRGCCCTASIHFWLEGILGVCSVLNRSESIRDRNFEYVEGILGVSSALNRSESIRDRNFEYVDVIVAVNNPLR